MTRRHPWDGPRFGPEAGFCLAEFLVAATAGAVVLAAALQALEHFQTRFWRQLAALDLHQELRLGLQVLTEELRLAGTNDPGESALVVAEAERLEFVANLDGRSTRLTQPVGASAAELAVEDGGGWPKGKRIDLCDRHRCASARLAQEGQASRLLLLAPLDRSFEAGTPVTLVNRVRYYLKPKPGGSAALMRDVDGGANTLIGGVTWFRLRYFDRDGAPAEHAGRVGRVQIELGVGGRRPILTQVTLRGAR